MISNKLISITDLRQNATHIINTIADLEKIIIVHNRPKAALIHIKDYENFKKYEAHHNFLEHIFSLSENLAFEFLDAEPDLYADH